MDPSIETVLVATDGSDDARRGAAHGIALATATDAECHAVSVVADTVSTLARSLLGDDAIPDALQEDAEEAVADVAALADAQPSAPAVTTAVRAGRPHEAIEAYADAIDADAIVVGTEGRSGLDRARLGSVAENVLRTAHRPVLAVPPGAPDDPAALPRRRPYRSLLFPTDGSDGSDRALPWAVWLASTFDASLHALFAADATPVPTTAASRDLLEALRSAGNDAIARVREAGEDADVEVEGAVGAGAPGPTILEYLEEEPVDLVVMGTHGRSGVERAILGSVTEHVVRNGDVPVFCVPPVEA